MNGGFGQCPRCGKLCLIIAERGTEYVIWPSLERKYIKVVCACCGYSDKIYL